jgi:hypothetical protein
MALDLVEGRHQLRDDPVLLTHATAPWDDELQTPEEAAAIAKADEAIARGELDPLDEESVDTAPWSIRVSGPAMQDLGVLDPTTAEQIMAALTWLAETGVGEVYRVPPSDEHEWSELEMTTREALHRLIDELPECDLHMAEMLIEWRHRLRDEPMLLSLATAPYDDEPVTAEEEEGAAEAREELRRGEYLTAEEAKRLLLP